MNPTPHHLWLLLALLITSCKDTTSVNENTSLNIGTSTVNHDELIVYENGFIYDSPTIERLNYLVDSLHVRFRNCDRKKIIALPQGMASVVTVDKNKNNALKAMRNGISLRDFKNQFPSAKITSKHWMVKRRYDENETKRVSYESWHQENSFHHSCDATPETDKSQGWVIVEPEDEFDLIAVYLEGMTTPQFPDEYSGLIQYVDCMVDTTTDIFTGDRDKEPIPELRGSNLEKFIALVDDYPGAGARPSTIDPLGIYDSAYYATWDAFKKKYRGDTNVRLASLDEKMRDPNNRELLVAAAEDATQINQEVPDLNSMSNDTSPQHWH